jgi:hypothetical protein
MSCRAPHTTDTSEFFYQHIGIFHLSLTAKSKKSAETPVNAGYVFDFEKFVVSRFEGLVYARL